MSGGGQKERDTSPVPALLATVSYLASFHSRPFSSSAVLARLPQGVAASDLDAARRMLDAVGLKAKPINATLTKLDAGSLPVIVFRDKGPLILVSLDAAKDHAEILDPLSNDLEERKLSTLASDVSSGVLLVAPKEAVSTARLSPAAKEIDPEQQHWLWSELGKHKSAWAQVALAALGINLAGLALPIFVMNVFDRVIPNLAFVTLMTLAMGVGLALALDLLLRLLRSAIIQRVSRRSDLAIASNLFGLALRQRLLAREGGAAGAVTNLRDFEVVRDFFTSSTLVSVIDLVFVGIFLFVLTLIVGPLAWVPIVAIPVMLLFAVLAQLPISRSARKAQQMNVKRNVVLIETLAGLETIKSIGAEPVVQREWENAVAASSRVTAQTRNWSTFTGSATMLIQQLVSAGIICWGVFLVSDGTVSLGALVAANILAGRILSPLAGITQTIFRANLALWSKRSIDAFVKTDTEQHSSLRSSLTVQQGRIRLENVSFSYPETQIAALNDVSLEFEPGQTTALLGRIGSGKSTLGKLLNGTHLAGRGTILIDGYEIAQYEPAEVRRGIGYLPQDPVLFTGTLRENITMGRPEASEEEIRRALYFAALDSFVGQLPEGLNFFIGERGERLSGGQRQALSLARLLLRRPKFLFLDEPTNAMDHQTEMEVIERLRDLQSEGVGLVLCTHRMSLAAIAERFIVLEKGFVAMNGPRDLVMKQLTAAVPADSRMTR
ncbi:MAG: ATP-binding cassette domain-containing protein [Pseudomonadota bacterium]